MKRIIRIVGCVLLAAAMSSPAWAKPGKGGGGGGGGAGGGSGDPGESQAGGLPALEDRVDAIDAEVMTLISEVSVLTGEVNMLTTEVNTLNGEVASLTTAVTDLQGRDNFAVVTAACAITSGSSSAVSATPIAPGECEVTFNKNVSACSSVATIVGVFGEVSVLGATKTVTGDSVEVFTAVGGVQTSTAFNLTVTCS